MVQTPGFDYSHETRGNVLVQDLTDWTGQTTGMNRVEREWRESADQSHVTASVTAFSPEMRMGDVVLTHLVNEWSDHAGGTGVEKLGFVSRAIEADIADLNVDVPQIARTFRHLDPAISWARE